MTPRKLSVGQIHGRSCCFKWYSKGMYIWLAVWVCVAVAEALLYTFLGWRALRVPSVRLAISGAVLLAVLGAEAMMAVHYWEWWWAALLLAPYRLFNLARVFVYRLQRDHLSSVCLRAFFWLACTQLVAAGVLWAIRDVPLVWVLGVVASVQFAVALLLLRASVATWEYARPLTPLHHYTDAALPSLSVLVPARDESQALQTCLESLIRSDYPKLEILVLDDCSQNRHTPDIIRGFARDGVRFVRGQEPPRDWVAKNYGYEQLRQEASGEVLLFCGVDTSVETTTLRALMETLLSREKDMLSVLPARPLSTPTLSLLQSMRYYWELCLPRRMFKRPPVLSTCWMIRARALDDFGGFGAFAQSVSPEAACARLAVVRDAYTFIRSYGAARVYSLKTPAEQYENTVRVRYPQLHRRLELVAAAAAGELLFFVGPFVGMPGSLFLPHSAAFFAVWAASALTVEVLYYLIAVQTRLQSAWVAFLAAPVAFALDVVMLHVSLFQYEFGTVNWKGRNVCVPVMRLASPRASGNLQEEGSSRYR